jgi:hypothetical protein
VGRSEESIVGPGVADQDRLRPPVPTSDLDDYIEFLAQLEALFGPPAQPREVTSGDRFLL